MRSPYENAKFGVVYELFFKVHYYWNVIGVFTTYKAYKEELIYYVNQKKSDLAGPFF